MHVLHDNCYVQELAAGGVVQIVSCDCWSHGIFFLDIVGVESLKFLHLWCYRGFVIELLGI